MKSFITLFISFLFIVSLQAQEANADEDAQKLPYYQIPDYPASFTAETVAARLIDGLGFRYYWATEGLRPQDLEFKPSEEARTTDQTIDHLLGLTNVIVNSVKQVPNTGGDGPEMTFEERRIKTLENIKTASELLKSGDVKLEDCKIVFQNPNRSSEYPFWNNINGPIADAIWHCGQVVSFRRSSGNPFNSKASVFSGKLRE